MEQAAYFRREKQKITKQQKKNYLFVFFMLLIPVLHFLVFWLYVNFNSFLMAFQYQNPDTLEVTWSFNGFETFFSEFKNTGPIFTAVKNTLIAFCVNTFIAFPLSIVCCYILYKKVPGYKVFRILFFLPGLVSGLVLVMMFKNAVDFKGPIYYWLWEKMLNHSKVDFASYWFYNIFNGDKAFLLIQIFDVWSTIGGAIIVMSGALYRIPKDIFESARIDGVNIFTEFFKVVLPLLWPTLTTYLIYKVAGIFLYSGPILLFDPQVKNSTLWTIGYYLFYQIKFKGSYYYAASVGMIFTVIGLPIILTIKQILMKWSKNYTY